MAWRARERNDEFRLRYAEWKVQVGIQMEILAWNSRDGSGLQILEIPTWEASAYIYILPYLIPITTLWVSCYWPDLIDKKIKACHKVRELTFASCSVWLQSPCSFCHTILSSSQEPHDSQLGIFFITLTCSSLYISYPIKSIRMVP